MTIATAVIVKCVISYENKIYKQSKGIPCKMFQGKIDLYLKPPQPENKLHLIDIVKGAAELSLQYRCKLFARI